MEPPRIGGTGHAVHTELLVAPTTDENVPGVHVLVHVWVVSPVVLPQVPDGQGVHADVAAPPVEYEPVGHSAVHAAVCRPVVEPYTPGGHDVHAAVVAPPVEYEPAGHWPEHAAVVLPPVP